MEEVSPVERQYTTKEKVSNWLYYHVWWLVLIGLLLVIFGSMIRTKVETARQSCDYCIAYVGTSVLPEDCVSALKREIAACGVDVDGDGGVTVKVSQYIVSETAGADEAASYGRTAEIALLTDISEGESYFFLVQYPEEFQQDFQLMAHMDGSPSADDDFGVWDKVYRWADCPVLAALELGPENQTLLANLYLGRRCFLDPDAQANSPENIALWEALTAGAELPET